MENASGRGGRAPRVVVVGAGLSGLCMAIRLTQEGFEDVTVYEKADRVGGTWRDNSYPGLICDVPSRYMQYSFAPNPNWSRAFSRGPEIDRYLENVVDDFGVRGKLVLGTRLTEARWEGGRWRIRGEGSDGEPVEDEADFVVTACGVLHLPVVPGLPGLEEFEGRAFHSARWDHSIDLTDKRVGVVGTGSTGVQIVAALGGRTRTLVQFSRTPQWILPLLRWRYTRFTRAVYRRVPPLNRLAYLGHQRFFEFLVFRAMVEPGWRRRLMAGLCRVNLARVRDRELRRRLTPTYEAGCKRIVASTRYYPAVQKPGVSVVTDAIERVTPRGVVTADGTEHELDVLVFATGFDTHALVRPMEFVGVGGLRLSDAWAHGPRGYATVAVPGMPNLFMLMGPNSPVNVSCLFNVAETQVDYVLQLIARWGDEGSGAIAPRQAAADVFDQRVREAMPGTVWTTGCQSWYLLEDGTPHIWPWVPARHRELLEKPELADYEVVA